MSQIRRFFVPRNFALITTIVFFVACLAFAP